MIIGMNFVIALSVAASWWGAQDVTLRPSCHRVVETPSTALPDLAWAFPRSCRIYESLEMRNLLHADPYEYCRTIVHEYGHLAGLRHPAAAQLGNIMNGDSRLLWPDVPRCHPPGPAKGLYQTGLKGTE
jgi:hypothetical protein